MIRDGRALVVSKFPAVELSERERTLRLEMALRRSEKLSMVGRLAAAVMHEINNPLQAASDLVYLIGKEADQPDRVNVHAAQLEEQLVRIQYIARQTLSYFRDTQQVQAKDLVPLVEAALSYHARLIKDRQIKLSKEMPAALPGAVFPGEFLQLVSNLVCNSAEALPVGGTLRVRLRVTGGSVRLTVADSGRGIPPAIQARLFEAFQSDKAETGNGLGLWICKTIVDKHGGHIGWRSASGAKYHGTVFVVTLPLHGPRAEVKPFGKGRSLAAI